MFVVTMNRLIMEMMIMLKIMIMMNNRVTMKMMMMIMMMMIRGCSQIMSAAEGQGGCKMLTMADKGGEGSGYQ